MADVPRRFRPVQWPLLITSFVIAGCVVAMFWALDIAVTGDEGQNLPEAIEAIDPVKGAIQIPAQTSVFVDLLAGYEGVLVIDGLELETVNRSTYAGSGDAGSQVALPAVTLFEPGNATLSFTPSENAAIAEFTQGLHTVKVIYWRTVDGRATARSYTWSFQVF